MGKTFMVKITYCVLVSLILSGCASCGKSTFIKTTPQTTDKSLDITHSQFTTFIKIASKLDIRVAACNNKLCATITPVNGVKVRFETDEVLTVSEVNREARRYKISPIFYSWTCFKRDGEAKVCSLLDTLPTAGSISVVDDETSIVGNDIMVTDSHLRSFGSTLEFIGLIKYKPSFFGNKPKPDSYQSFEVTLIDEYLLNTPARVATLPKLWVDGVQYELPKLRVETVTEEVCYFPH